MLKNMLSNILSMIYYSSKKSLILNILLDFQKTLKFSFLNLINHHCTSLKRLLIKNSWTKYQFKKDQ